VFSIHANGVNIRRHTLYVRALEIGPLEIGEIQIRSRQVGVAEIIGLKIIVTQILFGEVTSGQVKVRRGHRTALSRNKFRHSARGSARTKSYASREQCHDHQRLLQHQ
jgi:hypothetical protein